MPSGAPDNPFIFSREHAEFEASVAALGRREFYDGYLARATSEEMCWDELRALGRHGLLGMTLPAAHGGQDADAISVGIACEQIARSDFNLAYLIFGSVLLDGLLAGLPAHVGEPVVHAVAAGEQVVCLALTEPRGGSDAAGTSVRARPVDGGFRLSA